MAFDTHSLYYEVVSKTRDASVPTGASVCPEEIAKLKETHARLTAELLDGVDRKIKEASEHGMRDIELMSFEGGHVYDVENGYLTLALVIGPRERTLRHEYRARDIEPVVSQIRRHLFPFTVYHIWRPYTNTNSIRVCW